ncbi:hypothetical protein Pyn_26707 [Prunus yedoensis var. nudiflora]|uniref:Uncharacterized protein n=1 Tax=Prunus yedoensis var. nudiflora TaxID=2094558 RepID=A0A314UH37_PRUYE|nr:hypothetical protein Pyn_26707 [Prunus yedoensis var. nudiflora]
MEQDDDQIKRISSNDDDEYYYRSSSCNISSCEIEEEMRRRLVQVQVQAADRHQEDQARPMISQGRSKSFLGTNNTCPCHPSRKII